MTFVIICLDGFKYDYLNKTRFLKTLSSESIYGKLHHGFGFVSEFSAITGKNAEQLGMVTNNFSYGKGPAFFNFFKFLEPFNSKKLRLILNLIYNVKEFLVGNNQPKSIFNIPLRYSKYFKFTLKKNFFMEESLKFPTLFGILRKKRKRVSGYMWPFIYEHNKTRLDLLNLSSNTSNVDRRTFQKSIKLLKENPEIMYIHLFSADNLVHNYGTNSRKTDELINKLDKYVEEINKYADSLLIFSDHGMKDIEETWDVWSLIKKTNLIYGKDYIMFLDSTLARFWFKNKEAEHIIKNILIDSKKGEIINFKNKDVHKSSGDLIFQVNPGVLILPNFYQSVSNKAMHGYSDKCPDEHGLFLFHKKDKKPEKKDINIEEIFDIVTSNLT